jgi:hypothetical protein
MTSSLRSLELRALATGDGQANKRAAELRAVAVQQGSVSLVPDAGTLALTSYAPTLLQPKALTPSVGSIALTGYAPALLQPKALTPGTGTLVLTGYAPGSAQPQAITPAVGSVTLIGYTPSIVQPQAVTPATGSIALTGYAPSTAGVVQISPTEGNIYLAGAAPSVIQAVVFRAKLTPDVWLKMLIDEIMAVPLTDEFVWLGYQAGCEFTANVAEIPITRKIPDSIITTRQTDCLHVTVVAESYSTTMAEELYFVASELVP